MCRSLYKNVKHNVDASRYGVKNRRNKFHAKKAIDRLIIIWLGFVENKNRGMFNRN